MISAETINKTRMMGKVYVTSQVRNSGGYDVPAGETLTVSRAILNAGGFSDFSDKRNVRLIRKTNAGEETRTINVQEIWEKGKLAQDLAVQAGMQFAHAPVEDFSAPTPDNVAQALTV